jgi:DNA-directed RNA polymerase alpha subunit
MELTHHEYLTLKEIVGRYEKTSTNPNKGISKKLLEKEVWELDTHDCCGITVRLYNVLTNMGIKRVDDMIKHSFSDFVNQRNFGKKCLKELQDIYDHNGLKFVE